MKKDTSKMLEELKEFDTFESYYNENCENFNDDALSQNLKKLFAEKNISKATVIERSGLSEVYAYQIFDGRKAHPHRNKVLCLSFGLNLSLEETQNLLKNSGYPPLYVKKSFDCIVAYALKKNMSLVQTNDLLFDYSQETLG